MDERIFLANQGVIMAPQDSVVLSPNDSSKKTRGINTTFKLDQMIKISKLNIYENDASGTIT
jgi:hypothetical protein